MVLHQALRVVQWGSPNSVWPLPPLEMTYTHVLLSLMCLNRLICSSCILNKCYGVHDLVIMEEGRTASRLFSYSFVMNEHRLSPSHKSRT
jgi:hypothetical protein